MVFTNLNLHSRLFPSALKEECEHTSIEILDIHVLASAFSREDFKRGGLDPFMIAVQDTLTP